jgi:hypothetical protein
MSALNQNSDHDYELAGEGCWIKAGNVSILVQRTGMKVYIKLYRSGREAEGPLAQCSASQIDKRDRE